MRRICFAMVFLLVGLCGGCEFKVAPYEVQNIEVAFFDDFEANRELAEAVAGYAPEYYAFHVEGYDDAVAAGITYGAVADSTGSGKAFVWVRYDFHDPAMAARRNQMREGFAEFVPQLAQSHAEMIPVIDQLAPAVRSWLGSVFSGSGEELYEEFGSTIKALMPPDDWRKASKTVSRELGVPLSMSFLGGQFYKAFDSSPEMISLFYRGEFVGEEDLAIRVTESREDGEWKVNGFQWEKQADN